MKREESRNEYFPDSVTPPGTTILETINALNMTQVELAERTGRTPKTISGIINGKEPVTPPTALQLEHVLGIPAHFWMNRERRYREFLARQEEHERLKQNLEWLKTIPFRDMAKKGWIHLVKDRIQQLRVVLSFFGVAAPEQWEGIWLDRATAYRQSPAFESNPGAMAAWLRKGQLEAQAIECKPYNPANFRRALEQVRGLTVQPPGIFHPKLVDLCAEAGVAVVFVPELPGTHVYGATRWLNPNKALIQLSLRRKYNDELWFTFFHEAYHILHHGKKEVFIETKDVDNDKEQDADDFAADYLIPRDKWASLRARGNFKATAVQHFAASIGIAPGIVVGRLQHDKLIRFDTLNGLKIRYKWTD